MFQSESEANPCVHASTPDLRSSLPAQPPSLSASDKESIQLSHKQIIRTPVSSGVELRDEMAQHAHGPLPSIIGPLPAVHIATTEYSPAVMPSGTDITIQLQTELVATANELYRMDIEARRPGRAGKAPERVLTTPQSPPPPPSPSPLPKIFAVANTQRLIDEDYWSSFPPHIKTFAQKMYNIAQQMVQSDTLLRSGLSPTEITTTTANSSKDVEGRTPGAYPSLPFDPSIFSDPEFTLSVDQATAALGAPSPSPGQPHRGHLEFDQEEHEDDDYSEDSAGSDLEDHDQDLDENEFHLQKTPHFRGLLPATLAQVVLSYEETVLRGGPLSTDLSTKLSMLAVPIPAAPIEELTSHKKNKKVSKSLIPAVGAETPAVPGERTESAGSAPGSALEKDSGRTGGELMKRSLPLTANAMPAARAATKENISSNPPPSSRAQGKQPMSYAPPPTTATTTPTPTTATATVNGQQPVRTPRAASKAPIPPHAYQHNHSHHHPSPPSSNASVPQKHRPPAASAPSKSSQNNSKIWSTSSTEERERIKEFWLGLGEDERRNLVKIEKDTVLRKMKEQQKHSCSCAVCGRKRHAIEEELEVLYDAYYEELEQYANYQQRYVSSGGTIPPPPGPGPFPGSVELDKNGAVIGHPQNKVSHPPPQSNRTPALTNGRKPPKHESEFDDDEGDEDEYEEEEEYDDEEEEEEEEEEEDPEEEEEEVKPRDRRTAGVRGRSRPVNNTKANGRDGLFNLGSSLTVTGPGNILTVADDLLKNDGQKFLEMMEQLAERRMQREEEAAADVEDESDEEDDEEGDEDEEEDDEEDEDEDDEDEEEVMTEEQKMEEGKRMFSIFAARMFEQRVLQAFREKVAQERQMQLLRELEDEDKLSKEREAKKQTQNQKKKAKKILQKQARDEERAAKAAEKAAEEAASKAKQVAQEETQRKKREEERARREAARKAADEEKQRKDEERRKRIAEEKEREAERERKRKEKEEKAKQERREREEKERKAKEDREAKAAAEKAARDAVRKEQQEKEEREKRLAKEKEEKEKAEKERLAQQQRAGKHNRAPTSPRPSSSTQRSQSNNGSSKKILNKISPVTPTPSGSTPRPLQPQQQPQRPMLSSSQPATPVVSSMQNHFPPPTSPHYPITPGMMPPPPGGLSPRLPFAPPPPPFGVFGPGPSMPPPGPPPSLAPSALPRNFGSPTPFDSGFSRPLAPTTPIGPPSKASQNPLTSPTMLAPGPSRRTSIPDPGPVARPISIAPIAPPAPIAPLAPIVAHAPIAPRAPIARPMTGEASGSSSSSPNHRSPSPKGILGSSALAADDDEVVPPPGRRIAPGAVGQSWGTNTTSPRTVIGDNRPPWGPPAPPGFGSPRPPIGPSLWGSLSPVTDWQAPGSFFPNSFVNHINSSPGN